MNLHAFTKDVWDKLEIRFLRLDAMQDVFVDFVSNEDIVNGKGFAFM